MVHPFLLRVVFTTKLLTLHSKNANKFVYYPNLFYLCTNYLSNNIKK